MDAFCPLVLSRNNFSPSTYPVPVVCLDEETRFIQYWDADVKRSARWNAKLAYLAESEEDDLAQEARIKLVRLFRGQKILSPNYLRVAIKNSMLTSRSHIRARCNSGCNEVQENNGVDEDGDGIVQMEDSSPHGPLTETGESQDEPDADSESWTRTIRRASRYQIAMGPDFLEVYAVRRWASQLPDNLCRVYDALYLNGVTQREAAIQMGVSQPRIAELHRLLLQKAKRELGGLAA